MMPEVIDVEATSYAVEEPEESQVVTGELVAAPEQSRADKAIAHAAEEAFHASGAPLGIKGCALARVQVTPSRDAAAPICCGSLL